MLNIQIVHYSPLIERLAYLNRTQFHFETSFITEKFINTSLIKYVHTEKVFGLKPIRYGFNLGINARSLKFSRRRSTLEGIRLTLIALLVPKFKFITTGTVPKFSKLMKNQLELSAMHLYAIKAGLESNQDWILILEDDAILNREFKNEILLITRKYSHKKRIFINLNSGAGMTHTASDPKPNEIGIYRVLPIGVRCTTSYLISRETAKHLTALFDEHGIQDWLPIDVHIQIALQKIRAKTYWQDPPLFSQGSEDGSYQSNLR
jgi:hypothetical protein